MSSSSEASVWFVSYPECYSLISLSPSALQWLTAGGKMSFKRTVTSSNLRWFQSWIMNSVDLLSRHTSPCIMWTKHERLSYIWLHCEAETCCENAWSSVLCDFYVRIISLILGGGLPAQAMFASQLHACLQTARALLLQVNQVKFLGWHRVTVHRQLIKETCSSGYDLNHELCYGCFV